MQRQPHQVTLLGSSNGLVCASLDPHKNFTYGIHQLVFPENYRTRILVVIFQRKKQKKLIFVFYHYGFGYVSAKEDYKLFLGFRNGSDFEEFYAFSWKDRIWSAPSGAPKWISYIEQRQGALSNEKLHWLSDDENCILVFDLANEKFGKLLLPNFDDKDDQLQYANLLGVSCEGRLYVLHHMEESSMNCASIWYMKEHGVTNSWTKLFDLKVSHEPLEPITCLDPIFVVEKLSRTYENTFTKIEYQHQPQSRVDLMQHENLLDMVVCEETLVRLDDNRSSDESV